MIGLSRALLRSPLELRTPFLMLNLDRVSASYRLLREGLPGARLFYAVKANSNPTLLRHLAGLDCGFDAASAGELHLLTHVIGVPGERIVFSHPTKDPDALVMISRVRPGTIVIDSVNRLHDLLRQGIPSADYRPALLVRIQSVSSNLNKFGPAMFIADQAALDDVNQTRVKTSEVLNVLREAARIGGFAKLGVAFHVGTQCLDPHRYKMMLGVVKHAIADALAPEGIAVELVDIGGGFCDERTAIGHRISQRKFLARVGSYLTNPKYVPSGVNTFAEPGRILVADAGAIVTEFIARTEFKGRELAPDMQAELGLLGQSEQLDSTVLRLEINDSLYNNLLPQIHDDREWEIAPFARDPSGPPLSAERVRCIIFGHTCDGFDRLKRRDGFWLPADISEGTLGLLTCAGAYTRETAAGFNGFAKSDVVTYQREDAAIVCRIDRAERPWLTAPEISEYRVPVDALE